jgi:hypothetical protein
MAEQVKDNWIQKHWRPIVAISYVVIILFDFVVAPILWSVVQVNNEIMIESIKQWTPLTLESGGLFHMAIGAILGVAAFTRGQEKIQRLRS